MLDLRLCLFALALIANPAAPSEPVSSGLPSPRVDPTPTFPAATGRAGSPGTGLPHNLVLVLMDDVGVDMVGCYEAEYANHPAPGYANYTPCIDAIASEGMLFTNCSVNSMCSPTRALLMTGKPASKSGIGSLVGTEGTLDSGVGLGHYQETLPGILRQSVLGHYYTGVLGKWHLASEEQFPLPQGDPIHPLGTSRNPWFHYWAGTRANVPDHRSWQKIFASRDGIDHGGEITPAAGEYLRLKMTGYTAVNTTDDAISFLESREGIDEPVFLYVAYNLAHKPLSEPAPPISSFADCVPSSGNAVHGSDRYVFNGDPARETRSLVTILDNEIGRLYCSLMDFDSQSIYPTTFVLVADNGSHQQATVPPFDPVHAKQTVYQSGIHVPLIVTSPVIPPSLRGSRSPALVSGTDFLATLAELGGAPIPDDPYGLLDSISFVPVLAGASPGEREYLVSEQFQYNFYPDRYGKPPVDFPSYVPLIQAIVDRAGFKLIRSTRKVGSNIIKNDELYFLPADPHEQIDRMSWTTTNRLYYEKWVELGGVLDTDYPFWHQ